jgi:hypothetical protein
MKKTASICLLMPYFGKWPFWMPFFLQSCRYNACIDWVFYTDCGPLENCPPNVRVVPMSFDDYCALVSSRLDIDFKPDKAYKLCDIRPAFGQIHQADLTNYDFWGFGDIDLVYGDLRAYFTEERLRDNDLLSTHSRRVSGHLCLIRNNARMRDAFRLIPNWQARFCDPQHHALDEGAFTRIFLRNKNLPDTLSHIIGQLNPWYRRAEFQEAFSTPYARIDWVDGTRDFPQRWIWKEGKLTNDRDTGREFPYFHFIVWKRNEWAELPQEHVESCTSFAEKPAWVISAKGFEHES